MSRVLLKHAFYAWSKKAKRALIRSCIKTAFSLLVVRIGVTFSVNVLTALLPSIILVGFVSMQGAIFLETGKRFY